MLPDKDHEITVLAEDPDEARILLSAIVTNMVQSSVRRKHRDVLVSIRDKGEEIAQGAENISAVLRATHSAASYSLLEALRDAKQIPDTLDLTLEAEEQFCGRVGFCCYSPEWESDNTDTVLVIVDQPDVRFLEEHTGKTYRFSNNFGIDKVTFQLLKHKEEYYKENCFKRIGYHNKQKSHNNANRSAYYRNKRSYGYKHRYNKCVGNSEY